MKTKRILSLLLVGILSLLMFVGKGNLQQAEAADNTLTVSVNTTDVIVGNNVNVTVTLSYSKGINTAQFNLNYDPSMFTYVSGDADGSSYAGSIPIIYMPNDFPTSCTWNFTFKATKTGTGNFTTTGITFIDPDVNSFNPTRNTASIKIWAQGSDDATLSSLQVAGASLSPDFAKWTTAYTVYVGSDVTSVDIAAATSQGGRVEIAGNTTNLSYGNNVITVTSYAPNGKTMNYTITVVRPEPVTEPPTTIPEPTTEPPEWSEIKLDGVIYHINSEFSKDVVPSGFETEIYDYNDNEVLAATNVKLNLTLFYLVDEEENGKFFIYDKTENTFYPFIRIEFLENRYIVIDAAKSDSKPENAEQKKISIGENEIDAYVNSDNSDFAYFYALNQNGVYSWYCYDKAEKTIQRVSKTSMNAVESGAQNETAEEETSAEKDGTNNLASENESLKDANNGLIHIRNIAIIVAGVLFVVLAGLIVFLLAHKSEKKHALPVENIDYGKLEDIEDEQEIPAATEMAAAQEMSNDSVNSENSEKSDETETAEKEAANEETAEEEPEAAGEEAPETSFEDIIVNEQNNVIEELSVTAENSFQEPTQEEVDEFRKEAEALETTEDEEEFL